MEKIHSKGLALVLWLFIGGILMVFPANVQKPTQANKKTVPTVLNPISPTPIEGFPNQLSLTKDFRIGEAQGKEETMFGEVRGVDVDKKGRIFVFDHKRICIRVFDKDGQYEKTIGQQGQGPGELQTPQRMFITQQEEIFVEDHSARSFVYYSLDGDYLRKVSFFHVFIFTTGIDSRGNIIGIVQTAEPEGNVQVLNRYDPEMNYIHTVGYTIKGNKKTYNYFKPWLRWAAYRGDSIIFAYTENYELFVYDSLGELNQIIKKEYKPVKISDDELAHMRSVVRLPSTIKLIVPKNHTPFQNFTVDDENRIFVQTWEKTKDGEGFYFDVFNSDGIFFAKVPLDFKPFAWKKGKVYGLEEDDLGYQYVVRYSVVWH